MAQTILLLLCVLGTHALKMENSSWIDAPDNTTETGSGDYNYDENIEVDPISTWTLPFRIDDQPGKSDFPFSSPLSLFPYLSLCQRKKSVSLSLCLSVPASLFLSLSLSGFLKVTISMVQSYIVHHRPVLCTRYMQIYFHNSQHILIVHTSALY